MHPQRLAEYECFVCDACRKYVYDESAGEHGKGILPRTRVEMLPLSWQCPVCGAGKEQLRASNTLDDFSCAEAAKQQAD